MDERSAQRSGSERHLRRKQRSKRRSGLYVPGFFRQWWVEIVVALVILAAVFLLVERVDIRQSLLAGGSGLLAGLGGLFSTGTELVAGFVQGTSLSDLIAYVLIIGVVGLTAWRLRWRLMTSPRLTQQACPKCGGDLRRIRRRSRDRLVDFFVPVRRYQCSNRDCGWRGLRVDRSRHE